MARAKTRKAKTRTTKLVKAPPPRKRGEPTLDFTKAFRPGAKYQDQHSRFTVGIRFFAQVTLPTGRVFAADPFVFGEPVAFERKVKPGTYSVIASIARVQPRKKGSVQSRVACVKLRFASGEPATWVNATKKGQKISALKPHAFFGYGVDAGAGCFCDLTAAEALVWLNDVEVANDHWEGWLHGKIGEAIGSDRHHGSAITVPETRANIVGFHSGWGDGFYGSYWGLSRSGKVLCLVTDFGVYPTEEEDE